jgi:hypothetical protein
VVATVNSQFELAVGPLKKEPMVRKALTVGTHLCGSTPRYNFSKGALLSNVRSSLQTTKSYPESSRPLRGIIDQARGFYD